MNFRILLAVSKLALVLLFFSCEEYDDLVGYEKHVIKAGQHSSTERKIALLGRTVLAYDVIFDQTAVYQLNTKDQGDYNKLFGFSDCNDHHQTNSARFGWRWYNEELQIASYTYVNTQRQIEPLTTFKLDTPYRCIITIEKSHYIFTIEGKLDPIKVERNNNCDNGIHYLLYPYFGGNNGAPHDISIYLREIY